LGEERLNYLLKIMKRIGWQRIKSIRGHTFQTGRNGLAYERIVTRVDHHLVSKMPDVLNWVASFGVVVECQSREFLWQSTRQKRFMEKVIGDLGNGLF